MGENGVSTFALLYTYRRTGLVAGVVGVVVEDGEGTVGLFGEDDSG